MIRPRGIRPGRNEIESVNRPIECGGVLVRPGDVIVADGDGVVVVPREKAQEVAEYAKAIVQGNVAVNLCGPGGADVLWNGSVASQASKAGRNSARKRRS
jgi:hypothetical protein